MEEKTENQEGRIIWRPEVLSDGYLPECLVGREEQRRQLEMCLSPMRDGQAPLNAWLHGPVGSGKSALAKAVAREICEDSPSRLAVHIDCWERRSLYSVVQAIVDSLKVLGAEAQDTNVKIDRIRRVVRDKPLVVILDDIDRVPPSERERFLHGLLDLPRTGVICISHRSETLLALEERTGSRLSPVVIAFPPYPVKEVKGILAERARVGLLPDTWGEGVLDRLAQEARGDARVAIHGLRQGAVAAETKGKGKITKGALPKTLMGSDNAQREVMVLRLSHHERLIWDLAVKNQPISTMELRQLCLRHCKRNGITPVARRTFSKYLRNLQTLGLLSTDRAIIGGRGRLVRTSEPLT